MSDLPDNAFSIASGKLGQMVFENPGASIAARLEFFVELAFAPFECEDETVSPILRINGILAPEARKWSALVGQTLQFPYAPKPGSVDAGIHLFYVQNPADITELTFSDAGSKLGVSFNTEVDFEIEADSELGQVPLEIQTELEISPLRIGTSIEKANKSDPDEITKAVSDLIDLSAYQPIEKVAGGFEFPVNV